MSEPLNKKSIWEKWVVPILALFGAVISIVNILITCHYQQGENLKWDQLNQPNIIVSKSEVVFFKNMTKKELDKTKWGYVPSAFVGPDGDCKLPYFLTAVDDSTGKRIPELNAVYTLSEIKHEIKNRGFFGTYKICKCFSLYFHFENIGNTQAKDFRVKIEMEQNDIPGVWKTAFNGIDSIVLPPKKSSATTFFIFFPIDNHFPDTIQFKIHLRYRDFKNSLLQKDIRISWGTIEDGWYQEN